MTAQQVCSAFAEFLAMAEKAHQRSHLSGSALNII